MSNENPKVKLIFHHGSCRLCVLFPDTGQMVMLMYDQWEHKTPATHKKVTQPHHVVRLLIPDNEDVIVTHTAQEADKVLRELLKEES